MLELELLLLIAGSFFVGSGVDTFGMDSAATPIEVAVAAKLPAAVEELPTVILDTADVWPIGTVGSEGAPALGPSVAMEAAAEGTPVSTAAEVVVIFICSPADGSSTLLGGDVPDIGVTGIAQRPQARQMLWLPLPCV